jgi:flagellar hook-associated protein 3 FlgL
MSINSVGFGSTLFGQAVQNLNTQLANLSTQLATGQKSTTYSGMGTGEGFAIAARSQLASISAFTDTITNVNTTINAANTALQSLSKISGQVQSDAASTPQALNSTGQTIAQQNAQTELSSVVGILNTQVGNNFIFSGNAINTPSVASVDNILNGTGTQAGLKQVISERAQADGTTGLGRLVITPPSTTSTPPTPNTVSVAEDVAGSPFGLKLSSVSSSLTGGATVSSPSGSPAGVSITLGTTNPNPGDQVSLTFNLPDGTTASVQLTASSANPPPAGSFTIGTTPAATAGNLSTALNTSIGKLANTTLVAASAVAAGHDFFDPSGTATGSVAQNQAGPPSAPISATTALSGASGTNSLTASFAPGDTLTVNGKTIQFYDSSTTPATTAGNALNTTYLDLATANVGNLLSSIDSITGTSTPSTVSGGVVTLHTDSAANLNITASSPTAIAALNALGFSSSTITAVQPPLRVSSSGNSLVNGSANTVAWYTGNSSSSPRGSETARIDPSITVQYGTQANEQAIRQQIEGIAVFAAVTVSPTGTNSAAQVAALSTRTATNLTAQPGQQTISDIQTDYAAAQNIMKDASARQTQSQTQLQNVIAQTETVSTQEVASQLLALQNSLSASYEATSMLAGLTLTKFLPAGG